MFVLCSFYNAMPKKVVPVPHRAYGCDLILHSACVQYSAIKFIPSGLQRTNDSFAVKMSLFPDWLLRFLAAQVMLPSFKCITSLAPATLSVKKRRSKLIVLMHKARGMETSRYVDDEDLLKL